MRIFGDRDGIRSSELPRGTAGRARHWVSYFKYKTISYIYVQVLSAYRFIYHGDEVHLQERPRRPWPAGQRETIFLARRFDHACVR